METHFQIDPRTILIYVLLWVVGTVVAALVFQADLNRRKIRANGYWITAIASVVGLVCARSVFHFGWAALAGTLGWFLMIAALAPRERAPTFEFLDVGSVAAAAGAAVIALGMLLWLTVSLVDLDTVPATKRALLEQLVFSLVWLGITIILWQMGSRAILSPKPKGEILSVYLLLDGLARFVSAS